MRLRGPEPDMAKCSLTEWSRYVNESHRYWTEIAKDLGKYVPADPALEYIGGGSVIRVVSEDKSYCWLGSTDLPYGDGPYAFGVPSWVGGYRYDEHGETFTERLILRVDDPDDSDLVVEKLVEVVRELAKLPFTESV
jgi:hypothetical protein